MKSSKNPRFFCESCGEEVPRNAKNCPKCGRFFASVLCPGCGFSGEEILFRDGCPVCGYSSGTNGRDRDSANMAPESKTLAGALPPWVFILTAAALVAILTALFFTFIR